MRGSGSSARASGRWSCACSCRLPLAVAPRSHRGDRSRRHDVRRRCDDEDLRRSIDHLRAFAALLHGPRRTLAVAACFRVISSAYLGEPSHAGPRWPRASAASPRCSSLSSCSRSRWASCSTFGAPHRTPALLPPSSGRCASPAIVAERAGPFRAMQPLVAAHARALLADVRDAARPRPALARAVSGDRRRPRRRDRE